MGGAPAGLGDALARVVVAREEVEPVHQFVQTVVERDLVIAEKFLETRRAGNEGQQPVAEKLAHAVGGIKMDRVGAADAERHARIGQGLEVGAAPDRWPAGQAAQVGAQRRQALQGRLHKAQAVIRPADGKEEVVGLVAAGEGAPDVDRRVDRVGHEVHPRRAVGRYAVDR